MFPGNPLCTVVDFTERDPTGQGLPAPAERHPVGAVTIVQTSRNAPGVRTFTRKDHERVMAELNAERDAALAAERAVEAARVRHIFEAAVQRRAARIDEADRRLAQAKYGNSELSIIAAAKRLAGLST